MTSWLSLVLTVAAAFVSFVLTSFKDAQLCEFLQYIMFEKKYQQQRKSKCFNHRATKNSKDLCVCVGLSLSLSLSLSLCVCASLSLK